MPLRRRPAETVCLGSDTTASAGHLRPAMQASRGRRNSRVADATIFENERDSELT